MVENGFNIFDASQMGETYEVMLTHRTSDSTLHQLGTFLWNP
jgi:hypothetical protein